MSMQDISNLISQLGFPIFVAGYMLVKQSKDTENMSSLLKQLQTAIESLSSKIDRSDK
jgi:hypothetical protein